MTNKTYNIPILYVVILTLMPISQVATDIYTPSLPAITSSLNASHAQVQWTISFYLLALSIGQLIYGPLSDRFGRRPPLITGISIFIIASLAASFSHTITQLILARMLQGCGISAASVSARSVMTDCFQGKAMSRIATMASMVWCLGPILAPFIGGLIQHSLGWQYNFLLLTLLATLLLAEVIFLLPETIPQKTKLHPLRILKNFAHIAAHRQFIGAFTCMAVGFAIVLTFNIFAPYLIQNLLHYNAAVYGQLALLIGVAYFLGSTSNFILIRHFSAYSINITCILLMTLASSIMLFFALTQTMTLLNIMIPTAFIAYSSAIIFPNSMAVCLQIFPEKAGTANAVLGFFTVAIAALFTFIDSQFHLTNSVPLAGVYLCLSIIALIATQFLLFTASRGVNNNE